MAAQCKIEGFSISKVVQKQTNKEVPASIWQSLFHLAYSTGIFSVLDSSQTFRNYLIYIDAINSFGTKSGSQNYLIDISYLRKPVFESEIEPVLVEFDFYNKYKNLKQVIKLPKTSQDAQEVKVIDVKLYPYLNIDIDSATIDLKKIRIQDYGDHLIKIQLINSDYKFTEYQLKLKITEK